MITGINESKTLKKHVSCKCECKFDSKKCNSNQIWNMINVDVSAKIQEKMSSKKGIFGILLYVLVKMAGMQKVLLMIQ